MFRGLMANRKASIGTRIAAGLLSLSVLATFCSCSILGDLRDDTDGSRTYSSERSKPEGNPQETSESTYETMEPTGTYITESTEPVELDIGFVSGAYLTSTWYDVIDDNDATVIGHTMPKHTGGFNINGNYKNFDFSLGFTYQIGGNVYNANVMHDMMGNKDNDLGGNRLAEVKDCYRIYDVDGSGNLVAVTEPSALAALNANAKYALPYSEYGLVSSEFIEDASYLRLNTLTLGYSLPKTWLKSVGIQNVRVYFTGSNLLLLSGYSGLDPDVNTNMNAGGDGFPTPYYDYQAYPKTRSYTFGLNITF